MWTWLGIAVLARVLMASHEVDLQFVPSASSLSGLAAEDEVGEAELQEESSRQTTAEPATKTRLFGWKNNKIFRDISPYDNSISGLIAELSSPGSKIPPNSRTEPEDEREKRSAAKQREALPSGSWMTWMTAENKPFRNSQDPWQEIKKSRAFGPWGGKRVISLSQGPKVRRPIRVPFNSWGGKRGFSEEEKRARFSSWGGKRGWYIGPEDNSVEKRTKFNAWGGKRSKNGDRDDEEIKRNRFNAWGGKRNDKTEKRTPEEVEVKKRVFNAWGGKRSFTGDEVNPGDEKGLKYGGWYEKGGNNNMFKVRKPGDGIEVESLNNLVDENVDEESEAPLESEIIELPEKKGGGGSSRSDYIHKSLFNPWGGKKRGENDPDEIGAELNLIQPESHHHNEGRFWPLCG